MRWTHFIFMSTLTLSPYTFAQDHQYNLQAEPQQISLISGLFEISGLAVASENSVYAHNDEHSIVYEIDISSGQVQSAFALGNPTLAADFEGIAAWNGRIYLITSDGLLYEALIGAHQSRAKFNAYDTGVGEFCEVEGLAVGPAHPSGEGNFLILCKSARQPELRDRLNIFTWNLEDRLPVSTPWMSLERDDILKKKEQKKFKPSAIEWKEDTAHLLIISGSNNQYIRLAQEGTVIAKSKLRSQYHRQAEGLTIMPSGHIVIADEGSSRQAGQLSIYKP